MIDLHQVTKVYGETVALHQTDISLQTGKTTVLIGPSGCGKSTLLRIIVGLTQPSSGSAHFAGVELNRKTIRRIRRRMGYVIQEGGLFPHLTARENVTLMARHLGWRKETIEVRVEETAALAALPAPCLDRYPVYLSGGERQRVSLMRALFLDPDLLLLDEPLGALDPIIRHGLQEELRLIFRKLRKTVVLVTHDMAEAAFFGDKIILLKDGRIVQSGKLRDLLDNPVDSFVELFIRAQRSIPFEEDG